MDIAVQVATWPADAPRGAVTRFCREYQVSRSWFYQVRARVAAEGVEGLERRPRRPGRSPLAVPIEIEEIAVRLRKELAEDGCMFQLEDDHSRCAVASRAATRETSQDAIAVFDAGVAAYQVPHRLLTDNHASLNPTRRGFVGQLVNHVQALGVKAITGRPHHPQTQGKDERLHATTLKWLQARPRAATLAELQAQLDQFDHYYNQLRGHQALGRDRAGRCAHRPRQPLRIRSQPHRCRPTLNPSP
jgi:transposase InsO family protein